MAFYNALLSSVSLETYVTIIIVLAALIAFFWVSFCFYMLWWQRLAFKMGKRSPRNWSPEDEFSLEKDTVCIEKDPEKDFVILTLADIQVHDLFRLNDNRIIYKTIKGAVEKAKPDLIVLLGDNCWGFSRQCYKRLCYIMDGFGVPWAPVFGNHDMEGNADLAYLANIMEKSKRCLFRQGPRNVTGTGNYAINIVQDGNIIHTLFLFDTGTWQIDYDENKVRYLAADEKMKEEMPAFYAERIIGGKHAGQVRIGDSWGTLSYEQLDYYEWLLDGITAANGGVMPKSSMYMHIPLYEYNDAYIEWIKGGRDPRIGFGEINEKICSPALSTGMFDLIRKYGSTENVICGHDHENNFSAIYKGVRLSYGMKCADECSWREYMSGGSILTVDENGKGEFSHVCVTPAGLKHSEGILGKIFK